MSDTPKTLLPGENGQLTAMRRQLNEIFDELHVVLVGSIVFYSATEGANFESSFELATLLRIHVICGIDTQMQAISRTVETLGGKTEYTVVRSKVAIAFGRVLREHRKAKGMSQEDLAGDADFDRTYPSLLERGLRTPTLTVLFALAKVLKVCASKLVNDTLDELKRL